MKNLITFDLDADSWNKKKGSPEQALNVFDIALLPNFYLSFHNFSDRELNGIDFSGDVLSCSLFHNTQLAFARFCETRLGGVDFRGANLTSADFSIAWCNGSGMTDTDHSCERTSTQFNNAILNRAIFHYANLDGVDFTNASLLNTKFVAARLDNANFENAVLGGTVFSGVDLSNVKGLHLVTHNKSSYIDIQTIVISKGNLPEEFLRGCGIPDVFIEYIPSLVNQNPLQYYSCFISYSSSDEEFSKRLYTDLQESGVRCWYAPEDMRIGSRIRPTIDHSIHIHDKLLLVLSKHSLASRWVEKEVETAFEEECARNRVVLFPIRLDNAVMETQEAWAADIRRTRHVGDFSNWKEPASYKKAFERLLRDLKAAEPGTA